MREGSKVGRLKGGCFTSLDFIISVPVSIGSWAPTMPVGYLKCSVCLHHL